jgi:hypothetical protein
MFKFNPMKIRVEGSQGRALEDLKSLYSSRRKNVCHQVPEDCEIYFQRSQQLVNKTKRNSRRSYAEALIRLSTGLSTQNSFSVPHNEGEDMQADVGSLGAGTSVAGISRSTPRNRLGPRSPERKPVSFSCQTLSETKKRIGEKILERVEQLPPTVLVIY